MLEQGKSFSGNERNCAYLNMGGERFADISSVSGIDFPEDGRSMGVVDWDHDGDLDLWILNRTAPRLRFFLNETDSLDGEHAFVALRLQGTTSNRDAIGSRVEVHLANKSAGRLIRTLAAGDSFMSQSSKWLHFGLGGDTAIEKVSVRWPSGETETFSGIDANARYLLVEGSGSAEPWTPPSRPGGAVALEPTKQEPAAPNAGPVRVNRLPAPSLIAEPLFDSEDGASSVPVIATGRPTLVVLWASWCAPCIVELKGMTERETELRESGLEIVAVTVDGLDPEHETGPDDARGRIERLGFPFRTALATPAFLDKIDRMQGMLFDRPPTFGVPLSYLFAEDGTLVAIYRGQVEVDELLEDVRVLGEGSAEAWRDRSVPFEGRWRHPVTPIDALSIVQQLGDADPQDTEKLLRLAIEQRRKLARSAAGMQLQKNRVSREIAQAHGQLAGLLRSQGRTEEAVNELKAAVAAWPDYAPGHNNLALMLRQSGRDAEAVRHLREALRIQPGLPEAHNNLANALRATGKVGEAIEQYEAALQASPTYRVARRNLVAALDELGTIYARTGKLSEAISLAKRALQEAREGQLEDLYPVLEQRVEAYRKQRIGGAGQQPKRGKGKGKKKGG